MGPTRLRNANVLDIQMCCKLCVLCLAHPCRFLLNKPSVLFALYCILSVCVLNLVLIYGVMLRYLCGMLGSCWEWIEYGNFFGV